MENRITLKELIEEVSERSGIARALVDIVCKDVLESIIEHVHNDDTVTLTGFGIFQKKVTKSQRSTLPNLKGEVIPERYTIRFKTSKVANKKLNSRLEGKKNSQKRKDKN